MQATALYEANGGKAQKKSALGRMPAAGTQSFGNSTHLE
jgi:hypothetical protein